MDWAIFDVDGFRTIHLFSQAAWVAIPMLVVTASGLGHIQVAALFARNFLHKEAHLGLRILSVLLLLSVPINGYLEGLLGWHLASLAFVFIYFFPVTRQLAKRAAWAFIAGGLTQILLKQLLPDRMRPSNFAWAKPLEDVFKTPGFPSGHTTTSAAIGTALAIGFFYENKPKLAYLMLAYGPLVGISRICVGVHYPTDVLAGLFVGAASAAAVTLAMPYKPEESADLIKQPIIKTP